jgi:hypothetical protein
MVLQYDQFHDSTSVYAFLCLQLAFHHLDLGDWVKTSSMTWYSHFLMIQYDNSRWIEHFRVNRNFVSHLTIKLKHFMQKDTKYRFVIPIGIRVACSSYKLAHGAKCLHCRELFVIGKLIIHLVLQEFVCFVNVVSKIRFNGQNRKTWPKINEGFQKVLWFSFYPWCH